ncbi:hypothetical protein Tco_1555148 [Tanacetum coccineum]
MDKSRSYLTHDKHQSLYDSLLNSLCLDDVIARSQADLEKILRKRDRDDEDPSAGPNQGKSLAKTSKFSKSVTVEEPVEEPVFEIASDDIEQTIDDVANDVDQPPDDSTQTKDKDPKKYWFKQPLRPPTPDPEWNKCQVVDDQPEQPWFNNMVSPAKDPLTFYELMATPIDFSNTTKVGYNKDAKKGIKHWGDKHQLWYRSQLNKILQAQSLPYLKDSQCGQYESQEIAWLWSLGRDCELYTPSFDPPCVIYEDLNKQKRMMQADELYKFSNGTLKTVRDELHHRLLDFRLGYNDACQGENGWLWIKEGRVLQ